MPAIPCQKCKATIQYTEKQAGKPLPCPSCGEVNALPGVDGSPATGTAPVLSKAAAKGLPPADGPETSVMVIHQAMFGSKPFSFLILWLGVIGGFGGAAFLSLASPISLPLVGTCAGVALLCLGTLFIWRLSRHSRRMEITTRRIVDRQGLVSRRVNEVLIKDIRDMQVVQSFGQRLLGIGKLSISTAGQSDYEIEIEDIKRPNKVREVIDAYRGI